MAFSAYALPQQKTTFNSFLYPLSYPLFPSPPSRIINAVILCIFNSITSALPHWKWTSLSLFLSLCVSDRGPSSSCRSLIHFVALCDSLGSSLGFCRVLRLIKRNCFIGEIYIQSIMLAMSPDVSPLGFLIHYAKDLKTSSSLSLTPHSLKRASVHAGRFLSNKVFAGIREREREEEWERKADKTISFCSSSD